MRVSVVIPTHRRPTALTRCLRALAVQDLSPGAFEVVVVADGPEEMPDLTLPFALRWLELDRNTGQAAARNAGACAAQSDWLLFLDDDMVPVPGLVRSHVERQRPGCVVFGKTPDPGQNKYYDRLDNDPTPLWPNDAWLGTNCSVERTLFDATGGFDADAFPRCGEDIDLGFRLWDQGVHFVYAPGAVAMHNNRRGWKSRLQSQFDHGRASIILCRRYPKYRREVPFPDTWWKQQVMSLAAHLPCRGGSAHAAWVAGCKMEANWKRMPVLLYHHIGERPEDSCLHALTVSRDQFRRQLGWLKRHGYSLVAPSEWLAWLETGRPLPARPVMLTFDDGLADLQRVFRETEVRGAVFAITGLVKSGGSWEGRLVGDPKHLAEWSAKGLEPGGHTRTHPDLRGLRGAALEEEISGCRDDLRELGISPCAFAYPFGEYDPMVVDVVAQVFPLAFTCDEGLNDFGTPQHLLRRTMVLPGDTMLDFRCRVRFGWSPLSQLRAWLRVRTRLRGVLRRIGFRK